MQTQLKSFVIFLVVIILFIVLITYFSKVSKENEKYRVQIEVEKRNNEHLKKNNEIKKQQKAKGYHLTKKHVEGWDPFEYACTSGECLGLGYIVNLPAINGLNNPQTVISRGRKILEIDPKTCYTSRPDSFYNDSFNGGTDTSSVVSNISNDMKISGSFPTEAAVIGTSVSVNTHITVNKTSSLATQFMDLKQYAGVVNVNPIDTCLSYDNLSEDFKNTFQNLPTSPSNPGDFTSADWLAYANFFSSFGTHIITGITYGSRYQHWESVENDASATEEKLQAKVCAKVEGVVPVTPGWSLSACDSFSTDERKAASKITTKTNTTVIGGTQKVREQIATNGLTPENKITLIDDAVKSDQPITFEYEPIWDFLSAIFYKDCQDVTTCANYQRSINLKAFFYGYIVLNCPDASSNKQYYQRFMPTSPDQKGVHGYQCWAEQTGCKNSDTDCHWDAGKANSYCYGPSCIEVGDPIDPTRADSPRKSMVKRTESGKANSGANNSCYGCLYQPWGCCYSNFSGQSPSRVVWNTSDNNF